MSTSSVTTSGFNACICFSASYPFRAVPTTVNSPEPLMICDARRRMKALSSTTRTRGLSELIRPLPKGPHFDPAIVHEQVDAPPVIGPSVRADDWNLRSGERRAHSGNVAFADVHRATGHQVAEHARAAGDFRADPFARRAKAAHVLEQNRNDRRRELRRVRAIARH